MNCIRKFQGEITHHVRACLRYSIVFHETGPRNFVM
jgi:hypothetical protein